MKKFKFHLGKLLSYKDQNLENEMMILAALNKHLQEEQKILLALKNEQDQCVANFERDMAAGITPNACQVHLRYLDFLKEQIKAMIKKISELTVKIDMQIDVVKNLKLETRSLEIIKETRYDEYKKEVLKESEKEIDEFMTTAKIIKESH
ncbi:flagellar FliJ family protein [Acetobacterium bakii]|uniref:Flagellar FliJ protein n=1 Tax=Acetobacterium bakii TaxID=52689 RepID=A0A0L6U1T1_9FIRM|nr:flagellar FliJ family protein [Acetobacterium bakii]KNZ41760.1 hypothetical protein AKG39_08980 [Acetobacterium bakii]